MDVGRLLTAMITPFTDDNHVDLAGIARIVDHLIETGTTAIVACGTTGESPTLSHDEKLEVIKETVQATAGRVPVIAGTGSYDTRESILLSQEAQSLGADGLLLVSPYYNRPTQEGLEAHFTAIANAVDIPIMLYNVPGRTGVRIEIPTILRLAQLPNVFAVKEASGDMAHIVRLCANKPDDLAVFSGDDSFTLPVLSVGGSGVVSVAAHVVGPEMTAMMDAYFAGRLMEAAEWNGRLVPIYDALFQISSPIPVKGALGLLGLPAGSPRLPLHAAPAPVLERLRKELERLGKLDGTLLESAHA